MENYFYITPEDYIEAEKNGICKDTLETRVRKLGWSVKRAKTEKVRKKHRISKELLEIAKANGIDRNTITDRIRQGWTVEEACRRPKKSGRQRKYPDWVYEEADRNGIRYSTVNHRVMDGWTLEKACTTPVMSIEDRVKSMRNKRNKCSLIFNYNSGIMIV